MWRGKGWDEAQVRGQSVMGSVCFTAIDAPGARPEAAHSTSEKLPAHHDVRQLSSAAAYLGRGDVDATVATGKRNKSAWSRGKKRARTEATGSIFKRHKHSNISDSMTVAKAKPRRKAGNVDKDSMSDEEAKPHIEKIQVAIVDEAVESNTEVTQPLPVFTHPTSMTSIQSMQQAGVTTSLDTIRASKQYSQTVYNGRESPTVGEGVSEVAQPWLNLATSDSASNEGASKSRPESSKRISQQAKPINKRHPSPERPDVSPRTQLGPCTKARGAIVANQQLPTPVPSDASIQATSTRKQTNRQAKSAPPIQTDEECFSGSDESNHAEAFAAADDAELTASKDLTPPSRRLKDNVRVVNPDEDYGGALFSSTENQKLENIKQTSASHPGPRPIVRKPFPEILLDRSAIFGASNNTTLRTCFRVGEAMNVGCRAVRMNKNVLLELYARVTQSHREEKPRRVQHFVFKDLYHDKPPHTTGAFDLWDQSRLWELDSRVFLSAAQRHDGIMCRAIARMKRDGLKWRLEVLSIWEASWEDVEVVAGIYSKSGEEPWLNR